MKKNYFLLISVLLGFIISGCTGGKFIVKKSPTETDEGFRYFLPKPYLLISNKIDENSHKIDREAKIIYLPNFEEEYSITVLGGTAGTFNGTLKLEDGWKLTQVDQQYDTKTAETINAAASLMKELGQLKNVPKVQASQAPEISPPPFELYEIDLRNRKLIPLEILLK
jgi:hypothetical protein